MIDAKKAFLVKPSKETPFHIDFEWWQQHDNNYRVILLGCLCPEHQNIFSNADENILVDWVDPETAEVHSIDGLQHILMSHCAQQEDFLPDSLPLVDAVFRVFLANGNTPLTPEQLSELVHRDPAKILQVFSGSSVFKGIRPLLS